MQIAGVFILYIYILIFLLSVAVNRNFVKNLQQKTEPTKPSVTTVSTCIINDLATVVT